MNKETKNSPAKLAANARYVKKTYDTVRCYVHKGDRERITAHAAAQGLTVSTYILRLISADMGGALGGAPDEQDTTED